MINYTVNPDILKPYLPYKTEVDYFNNECYLSLVGFMFINTCLMGIKIPLHVNFEEVNLRFYVRYKSGDEWKRGVVFIKEIVPKPALTFVANAIYKENYVTMPMKHSFEILSSTIKVTYEWKHQQNWNKIAVLATNNQQEILSGSEAEFITEHYWGYTKLTERSGSEYQVEHPVWLTYPVKNYDVNVDFKGIYGNQFEFLSNSEPVSVFLAEGSAIAVRPASVIR